MAHLSGGYSVSLRTLIHGENPTTRRMQTEEVYTPTPITTATTTQIMSGPGTFGGLVINKAVATGNITIYDALTATGTPKAIITFGATLLNDPPLTWGKAFVCSVGLTIVTDQAFNLTVLSRQNS